MSAIAIVTATEVEQRLLRDRLGDAVHARHGGRRRWHGSLGGRSIILIAAGLGAVNTAQGLTSLLEAERPDMVVQVGVGGVFGAGHGVPGTPGIGDLAVATEEIYGDVGVRTEAGWQPADLIGIPLLEVDGEEYYNRFALDAGLAGQAVDLLRSIPDATVAAGPFLTVQECTGTQALAEERARLFPGVLCENMEGAAAAHVCRLYGVPLLEVRSFSNVVGERQRERWDLPGAAAAAQGACLHLVRELEL